MPYYQLKCADCDHEFEAKASMEERGSQAIRCPSCGSFRMETLFRNLNVIRTRGDKNACESGACRSGCAFGNCGLD